MGAKELNNCADENMVSAMTDTIKHEYPNMPLRLGLTVPGILHVEKSPSQIDFAKALDSFKVNSLGPLLLMKHLSQFIPPKSAPAFATGSDGATSRDPLLLPSHAIYAMMAARVGSISDNGTGGWYSYRASKSAVFQLAKSFDLYLRTKSTNRAIAVALHPGTVRTEFTQEFWSGRKMLEPTEAAGKLLDILVKFSPEANEGRGRCWDWKGVEVLP